MRLGEVVSSQGVSVSEHVQERKDGISCVSGTVVSKHTLRKDLSGTLPAWAKARLGASTGALPELGFRPSESLGSADDRSAGPQPTITARVWENASSTAGVSLDVGIPQGVSGSVSGFDGEVAASSSHVPEGVDATYQASGSLAGSQALRATWFSRVHVCGPQCFPPLTAKKVQARAAWMAQGDSSSEPSLRGSSEEGASSPRGGKLPSVSQLSVTFVDSSRAALDLCLKEPAQVQEARHAQVLLSLDLSAPDISIPPQPSVKVSGPSLGSGPNAVLPEDNADLSRTQRLRSLPFNAGTVDPDRTLSLRAAPKVL